MAFTDTQFCKRQAHCSQCRDLKGGYEWRKEMVATFGGDEVDFDCPLGKAWGSKSARINAGVYVPRPVDQALVDERAAVCGECSHKRIIGKITVTCGLCGCGGLRLDGPPNTCRANKW